MRTKLVLIASLLTAWISSVSAHMHEDTFIQDHMWGQGWFWAGGLYFYRNDEWFGSVVDEVIECCKNW